MADKKEDVNGLVKHLEVYKNRLSSGMVPDRHKGKEVAYKAFLQREISRTEAKIKAKTGAV